MTPAKKAVVKGGVVTAAEPDGTASKAKAGGTATRTKAGGTATKAKAGTATKTKSPARGRAKAATAVDATVTVPPNVDDELGKSWHGFKSSGDDESREKLILHYAPLVKYVASRVATGLPASVEQADLVSYGMFGLIDALHEVRAGARQQVRDLRDPAHQGSHHRRAAGDGLGAALDPLQGAGDREGAHRPRGHAEAAAHRAERWPSDSASPAASCTTWSPRSPSSRCLPSTSSSRSGPTGESRCHSSTRWPIGEPTRLPASSPRRPGAC